MINWENPLIAPYRQQLLSTEKPVVRIKLSVPNIHTRQMVIRSRCWHKSTSPKHHRWRIFPDKVCCSFSSTVTIYTAAIWIICSTMTASA